MRKIIFVTILFAFTKLIHSQDKKHTIEVIYAKALKKYNDTSSSAPRLMKNLEYQLLCNQNEARFEYLNRMSNDHDDTNMRFIGRGGGRGVYYKNLKSRTKLHQLYGIDEKLYKVKIPFQNFNWKLLKETKKILGYNCFKAVTEFTQYHLAKKRNVTIKYEVWYTPSIPIPFGPAGYDGLPGLVLESKSSSFYLIAQEIKNNNKQIIEPHSGNELSEKDFNDIEYRNWLLLTNKK